MYLLQNGGSFHCLSAKIEASGGKVRNLGIGKRKEEASTYPCRRSDILPMGHHPPPPPVHSDSPPEMPAGDMDVDVDPRTGRWWEVLTSNSLRMREFERSIKACGMSFEPVTKALSGEVDEALKKVYYEQFPGERARWRGEWRLSPSSSRSNSGGVGAATTDPTTTYGYTHAIPNFEKAKSVFNEILSQRRADASGSSTMASDSIANFLRERYPSSAPFNSEALLASGLRGLGIDDGRRGGGGNAFHPDTGPRRESPHPNKRTKLSVASSHDPFVPPGYYAHSGTHTLRSESTARSPSTWTSPRQSGSPTDASSSPSERRRGSFGSAHSVLSFSPTRGRGRFPATTRNDFIHRSKSLNNTCGRKEGGGQKKHSCEDCGMAFPYPSKLRYAISLFPQETKKKKKKTKNKRKKQKRKLVYWLFF